MARKNPGSPCQRHRWGPWEDTEAYDDRSGKRIVIQLSKCKNCPAVQTSGVPK